MNRFLQHAAFAVGLIAIAWVGAGYFPGNLLALALVLLIGAFFLMGALELHRFQQATTSLAQALEDTSPTDLASWLTKLHPGLQQPVRLRVEGERIALPGPALTPYLTGLLVLLGMLGTFLGMIVTLKGTGLALESATDVEAIRASLAAPVRGLGLAFGTSVAGVAASAMLGLMSSLVRRERQRAVQQLDAHTATTLRSLSQTRLREQEREQQRLERDRQRLEREQKRDSQREESLRLLRTQAEAMPALVTQLQGLVQQMERQGQSLQDRLVAGQAEFQGTTQRAYTGLAESVDRSLKDSLAESARLAGAALEPAVQSTLAGLVREATSLRETLGDAVQRQLDGMTAHLDSSTDTLARRWQQAVTDQQRHNETLTQGLNAGLDRFAQTFEQRSSELLEGVAARLDHGASLWTESFAQVTAQHRTGHEALLQQARESSSSTAAGFERHAAALLNEVARAHAAWESAAATRESERMAAFHDGLAAMGATLHQQSQQDSVALAERQQQICTTLEQTAHAIASQAEAHARATIGEITQLVQAASEAPRAAAEVIGELRTALSDSLVRDNAALDERNRLLSTLGGLLDAVNHASTEQRAAIDALVHTTTEVLGQAGSRFAEAVEAESRTLQGVAAQVAAGAAEVASLGEGFGQAVQLFSRSSEQLMTQLQGIEAALGHSMARSDEQLAYYVAQAREIVDLTLGTQKQIVEDLQQLAQAPAPAPAPAVEAAPA